MCSAVPCCSCKNPNVFVDTFASLEDPRDFVAVHTCWECGKLVIMGTRSGTVQLFDAWRKVHTVPITLVLSEAKIV